MSVTITPPDISIDNEVKLLLRLEPEGCTIVHCTYDAHKDPFVGLRIWPTTFLVQNDGNRRRLIKAFNISLMPNWTFHYTDEPKFTLVFEKLSSSCSTFQLLEDIPEPGGFFTDTITRNRMDVYNVEIKC